MKPLMIHSPSFVATALAKVPAWAWSLRKNWLGVSDCESFRVGQCWGLGPVRQYGRLETAIGGFAINIAYSVAAEQIADGELVCPAYSCRGEQPRRTVAMLASQKPIAKGGAT